MQQKYLSHLAAILSILTLVGVLAHDTRLDKATITALALPAALASYTLGAAALQGDQHNHVERVSFSEAMRYMQGQSPRINPRTNDDKKHLMQKRVTRGNHAFDGYSLPIA